MASKYILMGIIWLLLVTNLSILSAQQKNNAEFDDIESDFFSQPTIRQEYQTEQILSTEKVLVILFSFSDTDPQIFMRTGQQAWSNTFLGISPSIKLAFRTL